MLKTCPVQEFTGESRFTRRRWSLRDPLPFCIPFSIYVDNLAGMNNKRTVFVSPHPSPYTYSSSVVETPLRSRCPQEQQQETVSRFYTASPQSR